MHAKKNEISTYFKSAKCQLPRSAMRKLGIASFYIINSKEMHFQPPLEI